MSRASRVTLYGLAAVVVVFVATWVTIPEGQIVNVGARPGSATQVPIAGTPETFVCSFESSPPGKLVIASVNGWNTCARKSEVRSRALVGFAALAVVVLLIGAARGAFGRSA